jgi:dihydrofolate synthase / folylpolyglutamate synthase
VTTRDRLLALEAFGIKLGLDNMRVLMAALGHPDRAYPTVHIAGTNGKGSVAAMVERALRAAGCRTGLYTSPHLDRLEERMALDGEPTDAGRFDASARAVFAEVDAARAEGRLPVTPTFFEVTTAIAFDLFRSEGVDVAVVEVGLGGRFDATNVIAPKASAITSIALDHERHLGSTLARIAGEKAGIAKPGVPLVVGALPAEAAEVVERTARDVGAPLMPAEGAVEVLEIVRGRARVRPVSARWPDLEPLDLSLLGRHQVHNAATAVRLLEALDGLGLSIPAEAVAQGLSAASWPARLEWLRLAEGPLLIDAAHNPAGAEALASYLRDESGGPLPIVLAAMQDKDVEGMVRPLLPLAASFITTGVDTPRAFKPEALAARIETLRPGVDVSAVPEPRAATIEALRRHGRAVAAGSIYFVGPLRARLIEAGATSI